MIRTEETRQEWRALFQEALAQDLDRTTKELLDSAKRLGWVDAASVDSIDRWIATTEAALAALKAARSGVRA
jgi:hypothetical protein